MLLVIGGIAGALAIIATDSIANLVAYAWGGMGASFGTAIILALYWRRFNFWGALSSIVAGAAAVSIWHFASGGPWGMFDMQISAAPGFAAATVTAVVVTLLTSPPPDNVTEQFDRVKAETPAPA